ncbi:glycosyltransferase family 4 protein [Rubritalea squalenifaciens]|uniref:glycosyltransferase family 4 protein n=1 Tax=Rubritalea squalenifaciens TaxID=407226 RepID=UPI0013563A22|nr:glycosyltransferase [Rubritalea squalenifaciens]
MTRRSKRQSIEEAVLAAPEESPLRRVQFIYCDLPRVFTWLKKKGILPTLVYYIIWQVLVATRYREEANQHDLVHHLTFCSILCPGFWRVDHAKFVVGPVGGPIVPEAFLPLFGRLGGLVQRGRAWVVRNFDKIPTIKETYLKASVVVPANTDTQLILQSAGIGTSEVLLDTGCPDVPADVIRPTSSAGEPVRFVYAGRLERRKGLELQLRALAKARLLLDGEKEVTLNIIGGGPDESRLKGLAAQLGLSKAVTFSGAISRDEVLRSYTKADVFLFTSIRDTSASVNLEAMACGLPIVCLSHQGVAEITSEDTAIRLEPKDIEGSIDDLAQAIVNISQDDDLRQQMGLRARQRASEKFSWETKFDRMMNYYAEATQR